jgi:transposase-like protein
MHANAPLTPEGRLRLCLRIESGWSVTAAAESMNVSRQTAHKWWSRHRDDGAVGL